MSDDFEILVRLQKRDGQTCLIVTFEGQAYVEILAEDGCLVGSGPATHPKAPERIGRKPSSDFDAK
jgi:hypothetical protein